MAPGSIRAVTRWTSRIVPLVLAACAGLAAFVVTARVSSTCSASRRRPPGFLLLTALPVLFLLHDRNDTGAAAAVLVLHYFFLALTLVTYLRVFVVINTNPGVVPLPPAVRESRKQGAGDVEALYTSATPDPSPDSPGLESFYSKDVFVCSTDGRPIWCSACGAWKPDRAHHSSEMNRCVRKMDHYCPWVGGMVSETCEAALGPGRRV